ncbi:hypothetical protein AK965_07610 [Vibrio sp. PID17_43]|nr:hypothetical protein AK965_07610 [Vibrio sp. PID17_43]
MVQQNKKTLQDIVDKVGVTKMTVSCYMRNPESVAKKTRIKIAEVIVAAFVISTCLCVAQGSATVALTTTAALIAPVVAVTTGLSET